MSVYNLSIVRGSKPLYKNFSVTFEPNTVTALIAPSGAGKTTLFDCIVNLLKPDSGKVIIKNNMKKEIKTTISYLFQEPRLLPSRSILQNIELPLLNVMNQKNARMRALHYLGRVGLESKVFSNVEELSGGEKQRASLARAFAYPSNILLMDEAFQSQDIRLKLHLGKLFKSLLKDEPKTVVMVTHDIHEAISLADRILVLDQTPLQIKLDEPVAKRGDNTKETASRLVTLEQKIEKVFLS
ncbi:MAG: hypothetical protein BKP49_09505 [Treponema sp. CETP13]|nr:MAG: hypothetical protein BKP49_09505 [Treponema sp. CETP13]